MRFITALIFLGFIGNIVGLVFGIMWLVNPVEGKPPGGIITTVSTLIGAMMLVFVLSKFLPYAIQQEKDDTIEKRHKVYHGVCALNYMHLTLTIAWVAWVIYLVTGYETPKIEKLDGKEDKNGVDHS